MARDFQSFLKQLEAAGELKRVKAEVDPGLEMGAIADRVSRQAGGGSALLFENPKGATMPVVMNAYGSDRRISMALGVEDDPCGLDALGDRLEQLLQGSLPESAAGFFHKLSRPPLHAQVSSWRPRTVRKGACQDVVLKGAAASLARLPILTAWPEDAGPSITMGMCHVRHQDGRGSMGLCRLQVHDDLTLGLQACLRDQAGASGRMPVAVALGGDPVLLYAASAPLPSCIPALLFAGFLRGDGVEMARCVTQDLEVPAGSELVIEGWVDPAERRRMGPFGDRSGCYAPADDAPVMHVEALTMRKHPVYPAAIAGRPPREDGHLGLATERIFLPLLRLCLPEIVDMHFPAAGAFRNLGVVAVKKEYPGQVQKVMNGLWGLGPRMIARTIILVDADIDPRDMDEVLFRVTSNVDPRRDMLFTEGPLDVLDHAGERVAFGSKVGIDATRKSRALDDFQREWPRDLAFPEDILARITRRWTEYGL